MLRLLPRNARSLTPQAAAALLPYRGTAARLLYARGVETAAEAEAFLHPSLEQLHDPMEMQDMDKAVAILRQARDEKIPTVVYGDYDVDGICAASLMTQALRRYGIVAAPHTPLRAEGYGLNKDAVRKLAEKYRLLVTVDLGITNHEEVLLAKELGLKVIVTDHHGLPLTESPGDAVLNPLLGSYPYRRLCGTGVAFKVAQALLGLEACREYLDLAALATVADIVPLTGENRVLVSLGLKAIQEARRPGIKALLSVSACGGGVTSDTLGFQLGPRLNAAGRLDDAGKGVRLMMTASPSEAESLAAELNALNDRRKSAESRLVRQAQEAALDHDFLKEPALIVSGDEWHVGVIGLAAGRLCNQYHCPVCVLSRENGLLHGSLRSVPGIHIHHCLQALDDILLRYGGHEQAAGVTLSADKEDEFRARLQAEVRKADPACLVPAQLYDAEIRLDECTDALYDELNLLAPFGCENPAPLLLCRSAALEERRAVGAEGAHLKLSLRQEGKLLPGIAFSMGSKASALPERVDAVFALGKNTFRGVTSLQAEVQALLPVQESVREQFAAPDGEPERLALYNAVKSGLCLAAAQEGTPPVKEAFDTLDGLKEALARLDRGILAVSRTHASALAALRLADWDTAVSAPSDPRSFHTLLTAPALELVSGHYAQVWLLDGELFPGEGVLWQRRLPGAELHVLPRSRALTALAGTIAPDDESCRGLYRLIRRTLCRSVAEAAQQSGLTPVQVRTAFTAFGELSLIRWTESPFFYELLPPVSCRLGDSPTLGSLRELAVSLPVSNLQKEEA